MIISLAQVQPKYGDIPYNIASQETFIREAADSGSNLIVFPELSLTGYEPKLAAKLATTIEDERFDIFQQLANQKNITIITSAPLITASGITISLLIYQPDKAAQFYSKQYLHEDEEPFFTAEKCNYLLNTDQKIGLAICYELSVDAHLLEQKDGLDIYLASTAKTAQGCEDAHQRLKEIAGKHEIVTLFVNCIGPCDGVITEGRSAAWNRTGKN